jgi:hypothetical protein
MAVRHKRSRMTRQLVDAAYERFYACEVCYKSEAFEDIDNALKPL